MRRTLAIAALLLVAPLAGVASQGDDVTSLSYISYMERYATVQPASQDDSLEAVLNMPVVPGDRIDTARGARVEVQLSDGSTLWLDEYTTVSFDAIAFSRGSEEERTVLYLADGTFMLEIPENAPTTHPTRVDSGGSTVYLTAPGLYRLQTLANGGLRLEVWDGLAEVATPSGGVLVRTGSAAELDGGGIQRTEGILTENDGFASWVMARREPPGGDSTLHIDQRYQREAGVLDRYGTWVYVESADTWAWQPEVTVVWSPYTYGRWYWTPAGWTWISYEPWGWVPFHYGTWFFDASFGWLWCWDSVWGPAWVDWVWWPGYVGWCPRGYYDWWYWHRYWRDGYGPGAPPRGRTRPRPQPENPASPPPRRVTSRMPAPSTGSPPSPARFAARLKGEVRLGDIDPRPWRVVPTSDFGNPHLGRLVRPLEDVLAGHERITARVVSGPLATAPPAAGSPGSLIEATFRSIEIPAGRDLTPVLRRDPSIDSRTLERLIQPASTREIGASPVAGKVPRSLTTSRGGSARALPEPPGRVAAPGPNIHRPLVERGAPRTEGGVRPPVTLGESRNSGRSPSATPERSRVPSSRRLTPSGSTGGSVTPSPGAPRVRRYTPSSPSVRPVAPGGSSGGSRRSVSPSSRSPRVVLPGSSSRSRSVRPSGSSSGYVSRRPSHSSRPSYSSRSSPRVNPPRRSSPAPARRSSPPRKVRKQ